MEITLLGVGLGLYLIVALLTAVSGAQARFAQLLAYSGAAVASLLVGGAAILICLSGQAVSLSLWQLISIPSFSVQFGLRLDPLAAPFVLLIAVGVFVVSLYAPAYIAHYPNYPPARLGAAYNLFALSMVLVVTAGNAFTFILAWEAMSLVSYLLVMTDHQDKEVRQAGFIYLVMTHSGTVFIIGSFMIMYVASGSFEFAAWHGLGGHLDVLTSSLAFLAALFGFSVKAGLIPLHIWLPRAHPVAPSHISALMSGVMLKTAIYGLLRLSFDFLSGAAGVGWWGALLLGLGVASAILGVLYALMERDLKSVLAYSSVENIGIIYIGIGAALLLTSTGQTALAGIALAAVLFHSFSHALFKSLLFLGAGAVGYASGTRDIEMLGGLLRRIPLTGALFLLGSVAISGLPPLNGFAGEWLTLQALLTIVNQPGMAAPYSALAMLVVGGLALTAALAAACFVRLFGISFLGLPRSEAVGNAHEPPRSMLLAMALLALGCLGFGLLPGLLLGLFSTAVNQMSGSPSLATLQTASYGLQSGFGQVQPILVLLLGLALAALPFVIGRVMSGGRVRSVRTWACGNDLKPGMEYSGLGFAKPLRIVFSRLLRPTRELETIEGDSPYFPQRIIYRGSIPSLFEERIYEPARAGIIALSRRLRRIQNGNVHSYLAYIFAALVLVLIITRELGIKLCSIRYC